jgi:hypothetical protein
VNIAVFADTVILSSLFLEMGPTGQLRGSTRTLKQKLISKQENFCSLFLRNLGCWSFSSATFQFQGSKFILKMKFCSGRKERNVYIRYVEKCIHQMLKIFALSICCYFSNNSAEFVLRSKNCEQIKFLDAVSNDFFGGGVTFLGYHVSVLVNI